jgi:hypothetical protein
MPGMLYESGRFRFDGPLSWCLVHESPEMLHTCAGGPGEPLGYCAAWPGDSGENNMPTCRFEERIAQQGEPE